MTSIALKRLGHNVRILERSPTPLLHDQGAGIVASGEVPDFMGQYDRTKTPYQVTSYQRMYLDQKGIKIHREDRQQQMTSWDALYHICRANFDGYESEYVRSKLEGLHGEGTCVYQFGYEATKLQADGDGVEITYRSTRPGDEGKEEDIKADFVIIADGSSSKLRHMLCPSAPERKYAGELKLPREVLVRLK
jgi:2-polyprenyl-6-methoxyphenol hydroxylase-like FAD-dependent oxidoreductase